MYVAIKKHKKHNMKLQKVPRRICFRKGFHLADSCGDTYCKYCFMETLKEFVQFTSYAFISSSTA